MKNKKHFITVLSALIVFMVLLSACSSISGSQIAGILIRSAPTILKAMEDITPEQEYYIGRAVGANILSMYSIYDKDWDLLLYLNRICGTIVVNSARPEIFNGYHLAILDTDEINAFATSGGHIFVTRGLIACADSEDALAGVIAHEIGHIQLQHSIKSIKNSRINQAIVQTGANALEATMNLGELTSVFTESVGEIVTTMVNNGYSRTQEFEADDTAIALMAASGYDPQGLILMLQAIERLHDNSGKGFSKTHPSPTDRIANAQKTVTNYRVEDTRAYRQARYNAVIR